MLKQLKLLLTIFGCFYFHALQANEDAWIAPVFSYINLHNSQNNINSEAVLAISDSGNPLSSIYNHESFVARIAANHNIDAQATVEVSLNGVDWFLATYQDGVFAYDFGVLAIGDYQLQVRVNAQIQEPISFAVSVAPPERISRGMAPNEVGLNQTFEYSWEALASADYYNVFVRKGDSDETLISQTNDWTDTSIDLTHSDIEVLILRVQACNSSGCGPESGTRLVNVKGNVPDQVPLLNLPAVAYVSQDFTVSWSASSGADEYEVWIDGSPNQETFNPKIVLNFASQGKVDLQVAACNSNGCAAPSMPQSLLVEVNPDAPIAMPDSFTQSLYKSEWLDVLANDQSPNDNALIITNIGTEPSKGEVTIADNQLTISYSPQSSYCNNQSAYTDSFSYRLENENGLASEYADVTIEIDCSISGNWIVLPVPYHTYIRDYRLYAAKHGYFLRAPSRYLFSVGAHIPRFEHDEYSFIHLYKEDDSWQSRISSILDMIEAEASFDVTAMIEGIENLSGTHSDWQTIKIADELLNYAPTAVDDEQEYNLGTGSFMIDVLVNDLGPDPLPVTLQVTSAPAYAQAVVDNNQISYHPNSDTCEQDDFTYQIKNSNGFTSSAQVTLICIGGDPTLTAVDDDAEYSSGAQAFEIDVVANDLVPAPLQITSLSINIPPLHGEAKVLERGTIEYTPNSDTCEQDDFTYQIKNSNGFTSSAQVTLICIGGDPTLTAVDDDAEYSSGAQAFEIDVVANDLVPAPLQITSLSINIPPLHGEAKVLERGTIEYTPNSDTCVADSFSYQISNGEGSTSSAEVILSCLPIPPDVTECGWDMENVTVGQAVSALWQGEAINYVQVLTPAGDALFTDLASSGNVSFNLYQVGVFTLQCFDPQDELLHQSELRVDRLSAPQNLDAN